MKNFDSNKNQINENVRRMREIQKRCKQREQEKQEPVKVLWKSDKYSNVESKIRQDVQKPSTPRPGSASGFLRAHSRAGPPVKLESRPITPDVTDKTTVPPASSAADVKMRRNSFDFIRVNGSNARHAAVSRPPSAMMEDVHRSRQGELLERHKRGAVPDYLRRRQDEWKAAEEERVANTPDPAMPPGHRQLPQAERTHTLELLNAKQNGIVGQISKLPIGADTLRLRQHRQALEAQLAQVEEAIKIFSRPKVFVKIDD